MAFTLQGLLQYVKTYGKMGEKWRQGNVDIAPSLAMCGQKKN